MPVLWSSIWTVTLIALQNEFIKQMPNLALVSCFLELPYPHYHYEIGIRNSLLMRISSYVVALTFWHWTLKHMLVYLVVWVVWINFIVWHRWWISYGCQSTCQRELLKPLTSSNGSSWKKWITMIYTNILQDFYMAMVTTKCWWLLIVIHFLTFFC